MNKLSRLQPFHVPSPMQYNTHMEKEVRKTSWHRVYIFTRSFWMKKRYGGFSLVELLVIIAILGTLAGIAIPAYNHYIELARIARAKIEIDMLQREIEEFYTENGVLPSTLNDIGRGNLLDPWGNPYKYLNFANIDDKGGGKDENKGKGKDEDKDEGKDRPRKDRWMKPINTYYDLYSMGKDGKSLAPLTAQASWDDVIRANDGKFIGLASKY